MMQQLVFEEQKRCQRKAKKPHRCRWCGGEIPAGEVYVYLEGFWREKLEYIKLHRECWEAMQRDPRVSTGEYRWGRQRRGKRVIES